ncbi:MAG: tRNA (adenosine(37)-N6)-dimethylallyltransferase, partial [Thalassobaculaceae bacterium]
MTEPTYPPVIAILGPTASGKSALALDLATRLNGVVINADSMQVYRDLRVLTARPDDSELARAPHRLYGFQPADTPCSAAQWRTRALTEIAAAGGAGQVPILCGGTGLYFKALTEGLAPIPETPPALRAHLRARLAEIGGAAFRVTARCAPPTAL